jgi:thiosulfate/3-mercaptopyruvate sulfurtransferase
MPYAFPDTLVETAWVAENLNNPSVRLIESDEDALLYAIGHIPGAQQVDWFTTLQHPLRRDFISRDQFEQICARMGIGNDTTLVFYGDKSNWFACYALWLFQYYGHEDVRIMNGGRTKWEQEGRPLVKEVRSYPAVNYRARPADSNLRAYRNDVFMQIANHRPLVDVRSPKEFSGEMLHMANYPQEGATRGGHIPGAVSIPWSTAVNEADATFKTPEALKELFEGKGILPDEDIIAYCRIGERSSLTWFVLKYLLGYPRVRNYDGSWTEWGNLVDAPIEK